MKKYLYSIVIILVAVFLVTGCGDGNSSNPFTKKESSNSSSTKKTSGETITCTLTSNQVSAGYKLKSEYNIYPDGDVVAKVKTIEEVTSEDDDTLEYFESYLKELYKEYDDAYGGYKYEITNKDGKVTSKVTIDYSKMDLSKFVEDNSVMKEYINDDNKLTLKGVQKLYESMGATCE